MCTPVPQERFFDHIRERLSLTRGKPLLPLVVLTLLLILSSAAQGKVYITQDEALALAFPGAGYERKTVFLTAEQKKQIESLSQAKLNSDIVYPYVAELNGTYVGVVYFDTHPVRTLPETLMIVIDAKDAIKSLEVLSFMEPEEYLPPAAWYAQLLGKPLEDDLKLKGAVHPITGATLSAQATVDAARRILALHKVLKEGYHPTVKSVEKQSQDTLHTPQNGE